MNGWRVGSHIVPIPTERSGEKTFCFSIWFKQM